MSDYIKYRARLGVTKEGVAMKAYATDKGALCLGMICELTTGAEKGYPQPGEQIKFTSVLQKDTGEEGTNAIKNLREIFGYKEADGDVYVWLSRLPQRANAGQFAEVEFELAGEIKPNSKGTWTGWQPSFANAIGGGKKPVDFGQQAPLTPAQIVAKLAGRRAAQPVSYHNVQEAMTNADDVF
jgi:hypothetical protein